MSCRFTECRSNSAGSGQGRETYLSERGRSNTSRSAPRADCLRAIHPQNACHTEVEVSYQVSDCSCPGPRSARKLRAQTHLCPDETPDEYEKRRSPSEAKMRGRTFDLQRRWWTSCHLGALSCGKTTYRSVFLYSLWAICCRLASMIYFSPLQDVCCGGLWQTGFHYYFWLPHRPAQISASLVYWIESMSLQDSFPTHRG